MASDDHCTMNMTNRDSIFPTLIAIEMLRNQTFELLCGLPSARMDASRWSVSKQTNREKLHLMQERNDKIGAIAKAINTHGFKLANGAIWKMENFYRLFVVQLCTISLTVEMRLSLFGFTVECILCTSLADARVSVARVCPKTPATNFIFLPRVVKTTEHNKH